ncbi:hypothetical protein EVAR_101421_1 [Eumeta japonica]|uniref:Uncharacterized protein n=1 Tax=Eumeta variegata TaxID=151549 RepID=A0A4C1SKB7_EUMVA|nr:hypothetical protein EVAR_101421_1 [Eumeta japonica]
MELCSNNDISSESESDGAAEAVVVLKEKPILNSGRKKGLANRYKCEQCQHNGHKPTLEAHIRKYDPIRLIDNESATDPGQKLASSTMNCSSLQLA